MRSQASSEGRRTLTLLGCRARRRLRHDGRVATAVLGRADAHVQPALGLVVTAVRRRLPLQPLLQRPSLPGAWARSDSAACRPQRRCCAGGGRGHAGLDQRLSLSCLLPKARKHGFGGRSWLQFYVMWHQLKACVPHRPVRARYSDFAICSCGGILQICQWYRVCDAGALRAEPLATLCLACAVKTTSLQPN